MLETHYLKYIILRIFNEQNVFFVLNVLVEQIE